MLSLVAAKLPNGDRRKTFDASFDRERGHVCAFRVTLSVEADEADIVDGTYFLGTMDAAGNHQGLNVQITARQPRPQGRVRCLVSRRTRPAPEYSRDADGDGRGSPSPANRKGTEVPGTKHGEDNSFVSFFKALFGLGRKHALPRPSFLVVSNLRR